MTRSTKIRIDCPCCRYAYETDALVSWNNCGKLSTDLHQRAAGFQPIWYLVRMCPVCCYSACESIYRPKKLGRRMRSRIREMVHGRDRHTDLSKIPPDRKYEFAAWAMELFGAPMLAMAKAYLLAAWCADDFGRAEWESAYSRKAVVYLESALKKEEMPETDRALFFYLAGENHRRISNPDAAKRFFLMTAWQADEGVSQKWLVDAANQQQTRPRDLFEDYKMDTLWIFRA